MDADEIRQNDGSIITERNKAYSIMTTSCTERYNEPRQYLDVNGVSTLQDITTAPLEESTVLYSYPIVDADDIKQNDTPGTNIITEKNKAYATETQTSSTEVYEEPLQCLEANATNLTHVAMGEIKTSSSAMVQGEAETHTTLITGEERDQAS